MNIKPIITYSGAAPLFRSLELQIMNAIPLDTCEWRRTLQRPTKHVRLEAQAQPFNSATLERYKQGDWSIAEQPILHIFVTDCNDIDTYKATIREEIDSWLKLLASYDVGDWMILLVETLDLRKTKNLLPRTTVLDKIRVDFGSKNDDRCISVLNPAKFEQKSTESFRCLVQRIRFLMLASYNRNISKYEELLRAKRDQRKQDDWDYRKYFCMQEDLALVLEQLELPAEALKQYDELDVMCHQHITSYGYAAKQQWLANLKRPLTAFHGICLTRRNQQERRQHIRDGDGEAEVESILAFRNYLFERQAHLLKLSNDVPAIAKRLLAFLYGTLREIELIKVEYAEGALACWQFVCALEVLQLCEQAMEPNEVACFQHCAPIWNLAKDKLYELGKLCGLLPGSVPTSAQLHAVVQLSAGIGEPPDETTSVFLNATPQVRERSPSRRPKKTPSEQLKEALGSNEAFQKLYLELAELAISTYKHVSRLRSARLVGLDLGKFYCALNEPHKAVGFFTDLLRELKAENWRNLSAHTLLELANCYRQMGDALSYTKTCSSIACCQELEVLVRCFYFDEFLKSNRTLVTTLAAQPTLEHANHCVLEDHFRIADIEVLNTTPIIQDDTLHVLLKLESYYPREIIVDSVKISYELEAEPQRHCDAEQRMKFTLLLHHKQDKTLEKASIKCEQPKLRQPVRRTSSTRRKLSPSVQSDFSNCLQRPSIRLQPGSNNVELQAKATRVGNWAFQQLCLSMSTLEFFSAQLPPHVATFEIATKPATAVLNFKTLLAGIVQPLRLHVAGGSFIFPYDAKVTLKCSRGLRIRQALPLDVDAVSDEASFVSVLQLPLHEFKSFEERDIQLQVLADIAGRKGLKCHEHYIALSCPWTRNELQIPIDFQPIMESSCRLHTCGTKKFLQIIMKGLNSELCLAQPTLRCDVPNVHLSNLNPAVEQNIEIFKNRTVTYLYGVQVDRDDTHGNISEQDLPVIKVHFSVKYATLEQPHLKRTFVCAFELVDYTTLFQVQAQIEPSELCRVRAVCNLSLKITKLVENPYNELVYEVLSDPNLWAVCGRSAGHGIVSMKDIESHSISLDVMPLSSGYLPMPSIRLSKYEAKSKGDTHSTVRPFPPGQVYNATKSQQIHVIVSNNVEQ